MTSTSDAVKTMDRIEAVLDRHIKFLEKLLAVLEHEQVHITIKTEGHETQPWHGGEEGSSDGIPRDRQPT